MHNERQYLYGHTSPESAKVVNNYPWGFRLRTTIRYWIESKKAHGQRFASQTINPKTRKWCAPKYSTYAPIIIMYLDEKEHVTWTCLRTYDELEEITAFKETHLDYLDDFQKQQLKEIIAYKTVMKHVNWTITPSSVGAVSLTSQDPIDVAKRNQIMKEQEENKSRKEETLKQINRAINYEFNQIKL